MKEEAYVTVDANLEEEVYDLKRKTSLPQSQIGRRMLMSIAPNLKEP